MKIRTFVTRLSGLCLAVLFVLLTVHYAATKEAIDSLHFVALGDNGSGTVNQMKIAGQMNALYSKQPFPLVLMLGDTIYPTGNINKRGESRFKQPYAYLLQHQVQFKPVLGNHDVLFGHAQDEIRYFGMPGPYYDYVMGPVHFYALDTDKFDNRQLAWLDTQLSHNTQPWQVVYGHHPIYSSGLHGSTRNLVRNLLPLLKQHHANLYLCGHDHDYERFAPQGSVTLIVSGGGGANLRRFYRIKPGSMARYSIFNFLDIDATPTRLTVKAIDNTGSVFDSITLTKPNPTVQAKPAA